MHSNIRRLTAILCSLALVFTLGTAALADENADTAAAQDTATTAETTSTDSTTAADTSTADTSSSDTSDASTSGTEAGDAASESTDAGTENSTDTETPEEPSTEDAAGETEDNPENTSGETSETGEADDDTDASAESGDTASTSSTSSSSTSSSSSSSSTRYAVSEPEGDTHELYLTQLESNTCTLASAAMLIRNYIYLNGSDVWQEFGESDIRSVAWNDGLRYSFTYTYGGYSISVAQEDLSSPSVETLKSLLDRHPEGIVLYCGNAPHAVLLLDYEEDTFYCADPAQLCSGKRIALEDSWLSSYYQGQDAILANVTSYWYIASAVSPLEDSGLTWTWDGSTLTISGEGALPDEGTIDTAPWARYKDYVAEVVIEEGVTNIPSYAFYNYVSLTSVTLPETLETIGARAFFGCGSLEAVAIPEGVYEIGQYAFALCTSLTELTVPGSVTVIQKGLCYSCESLAALTLSEGTEALEASIIYGAALTGITLPASVTSIAAKAFQSCESLTAIYYTAEETLLLLEDAVFTGEVAFLPADEQEEASPEESLSEEPADAEETAVSVEVTFAADEALI
ncbi:MAG: leucine-rich repeat protein [Oscillospiraceae bacterium]|nr:leucine-rich repeat protein [Oscillospiraceae bacterium]